ncbi:sugar efflux transporter [Deinococcus hohokamensis]|uniref:Sugar efflux transporter n=1 Tax=Deinococcus hohokamensis TaxID=309883 RepID=A0ABV9I4Z8_9DEIO
MTAAPTTALLPQLLRLPHALGLATSAFLMGFGLSVAAPFMALFGVNEVHLTPLQLGIFLTSNAVCSVLISTRLARWSDRRPDRKPIMLLAFASAAVAYALLSVVRSFPLLLLVGGVFIGTGAAAFPQLFAFARAQVMGGQKAGAPTDLPERAMTVLRSVFSLSWVVGPGLGAFLLARWGFTVMFLVTAACFALGLLPLLRMPAAVPRPTSALPVAARETAKPDSAAPVPAAPASRRSPVKWVALAFVLYGMSMSMGMTMFPLFITRVLHGTEGQAGFLVGLCALLEIPVMLALAMSRRLPSKAVLIRGALMLFALHFALIYFSGGMPLLVASQFLRAAVVAVMAGLGMAYFQDLMPGRFGAATTLFANTSNVGGMLAGVVSGACAQAFGYQAVYLLCAALTFGAWTVMQWLARTGR